jgi:hypothetical protein
MTQQQHPITPPPELVKQWQEQAPRCRDGGIAREDWLMTRAAQWGADEELEACRMEIIDGAGLFYIDETSDRVRLAEDIWTARRPKPPSLKEQALAAQQRMWDGDSTHEDWKLIRRALEQLPDNN